MIPAEFTVNTMIARELHHSGIQSYLSTASSHLLCIPDAIRTGRQPSAGLVTPSHRAVQEMYRNVAGHDVKYVNTQVGPLVSLDERRWSHPEGFDNGDTLVDMRFHLDLSYVDGVFES